MISIDKYEIINNADGGQVFKIEYRPFGPVERVIKPNG